jgi:hypothetical protein
MVKGKLFSITKCRSGRKKNKKKHFLTSSTAAFLLFPQKKKLPGTKSTRDVEA